MRRNDVEMVEDILYSFPSVILDLELREYITESGPDPSDTPGSRYLPEQLRIIERRECDPHYTLLAAAAERICERYGMAAYGLRLVIYRLFFLREHAGTLAAELGMSRPVIYQKRSCAVYHMFPVCRQLAPIFRRWRCRFDAEMIERLRKNVDKIETRI
jgi:hypothetical protein